MGRPTKAEVAARKKAEAQKSNEDILKQQQELAKKAEERNARRAAEIAEKNKKNNQTISDNSVNQSNNDIPEQTNVSGNQTVESNQNINEPTSNIEGSSNDANDIPDINTADDYNIPDDITQELQSISDVATDIINDDFDPLKVKVIKRSYTNGNIGQQEQQYVSPNNNQSGSPSGDINSNQSTVTPIEPIISEPVITTTEPVVKIDGDIFGDNKNNNSNNTNPEGTSTVRPKTPPVNPKLDDLSASQKRKAAEKTADALITTYANLVPVPFKKISSFSIRKLEKRHINDEIDMNMRIMDDGTTILDYCKGVNEQADETFIITKEMQDEIKEPLIDVLLENNFALTPTQRLIMVVGGQVVQMGITAIQFMQQNSSAMDTFKKFHEENKASRTEVVPPQQNSNFSERVSVRNDETNVDSNKSSDDVRKVNAGDNLDIPDGNDRMSIEEFLDKDK